MQLIWVEIYDPQSDGVYALPVRDAEPARAAIAKGNVRLVTEDQAKAVNEKFSSQGEWEKTYLEKRLAERCRLIDAQKAGAAWA